MHYRKRTAKTVVIPSKRYFHGVKIEEFSFCDNFAVSIQKEVFFRESVESKSKRSESKLQRLLHEFLVMKSGFRNSASKISEIVKRQKLAKCHNVCIFCLNANLVYVAFCYPSVYQLY